MPFDLFMVASSEPLLFSLSCAWAREVVLRMQITESSISQQVTSTNSIGKVYFPSLHTSTLYFRDRIEALSYEEDQHNCDAKVNQGKRHTSGSSPSLHLPGDLQKLCADQGALFFFPPFSFVLLGCVT